MKWSRALVCASLCVSLVACAGDGGQPSPPIEPGGDVVDHVDVVTPPATDTSAPPAAVQPNAGSLAWVFETRGGAVAAPEAVFYPEDEPVAYTAANQPGFQVDVRVEATDIPAGRNVTLTLGGEPIASQALPPADAEGHASVIFDAVTLPPKPAEVAVAVVDATGAVRRATRRATVITEACQVSVRPITDSACMSGDADPETPGIQARFIVRQLAGDCGSAALAVQYGDHEELQAPVPFGDKRNLYLTATLTPDEGPMQGAVSVTVRALHAASASLGSMIHANFTYDSVPPSPQFSEPASPSGALTLADDRDGEPANGIQHDVVVTVPDMPAAAPGAVTLYVAGAEAGAMIPANGHWNRWSQTFTGNGPVALRAVATDACGNQGEATMTLSVWSSRSEPIILEPWSGAVLLAKDDAAPASDASYETSFRVRTGETTSGMNLHIECAGAKDVPWTEVGSLALTGASSVVTVPASLPLDVLGQQIRCRASVAWHNPATSAPVNLTVALPAPTLSLISPALGDRIASRQITLVGEATGLEDQPVQVTVVAPSGAIVGQAAVATVHGGAWSGVVDLDSLPAGGADGEWIFRVDAMDRYGNIASWTQPTPSTTVSIDTTPPTVSILSPASPVLDPLNEPAYFDNDAGTPGYQTYVAVKMSGEEIATGAQICLVINGIDRGCKEPSEASFVASWPTETLSPGENSIVASAVDAWGNATQFYERSFQLELDAPVVTITSPAHGLVTASPSVDVIVHVADSDGGAPLDAATVTLLIDDQPHTATATAIGGGDYRFSAVPLAAGPVTRLRAVAEVSGSQGASAEQTARYKVDPPLVNVVSPPNNSLFNLTSPACLGDQVDCVTSVDVGWSDLEPGSEVRLAVSCDGATASYTATAGQNDSYHFEGVTLTHGGLCELVASATDAAGLVGTSATTSVHVDRVAPVVEEFLVPAGAALTHGDDQRPNIPGMQAQLRVRVSGVEAGQVLTASIRWSDPDNGTSGVKTVTHVVTTDTPEDGSYVAAFEEEGLGSGLVDYPEGTVTITIRAIDAAGNATNGIKVAAVKSDAPSARITFPAWLGDATCDLANPCAAGVCQAGRCWHGWGASDGKFVSVETAGLLTSQSNLRICSDAPALASAPACATAGFHQYVIAQASSGGVTAVDVEGLPETTQRLIAEVLPIEGGAWTSSAEEADAAARQRRVYVDVTAPSVTDIQSPSDTLAPSGVLNIAEQYEDQPRVYRVAVSGDEVGEATVYVNGSPAATVPLGNDPVEVSVTLLEGDNTISATLTDKVGNTSAAPGAPGVIAWSPRVDTIAPSLAFVSPASSPITAGASRDVSLSSDAEGATVTVEDGGAVVATATVADGGVNLPHDTYGLLSEGSHSLQASVSDAAGNRTEIVTSPAEIVVDTVAPVVSLVAPAASTSLTADDDADPSSDGVQMATRFGFDDSVATWSLTVASSCDASWSCGPAQEVASGEASAPEQDQVVSLFPVASISRYEIVMTGWDAVGNAASASIHASLIVQDCVVTVAGVANPGYINAGDCAVGGTGCSVTLTGAAAGAQCDQITGLTLMRVGPEGQESVIAEQDTLDAGAASFDVAVTDGDQLRLRVDARVGDLVVASSPTFERTVDLVAPQISVTPVVAGSAPSPSLFNASNDIGAWEGFQVEAHIVASDDHLDGGAIEQIVRVVDGTEVAQTPDNMTLPYALSGASADVTATRVELVDLADNTVTVSVRDAAGNEATASFAATVDAQPPAAVTVAAIDPADVIRRAPMVQVRWTAPTEDGASGAAVSEYDVRYSRTPIIDDSSFEVACQATALAHADSLPAPATPGAAESYAVGGPDVRSYGEPCKLSASQQGDTWYFAVRARDDAGNWSPITASSATSTDALVAHVDHIRFTEAFAADAGLSATQRRFVGAGGASVGDIDGDGAGDFVVGFSLSKGFCVFYGGAIDGDVDVNTASGADHECLFNVSDLAGQAVSKDLGGMIAPLGDVNGDGYADFGVTGKSDAAVAFVAVYLGAPAPGPNLSAPEVIITQIQAQTSGYGGLCGAGNFDGAVTVVGSDRVQTDDIAVGEPGVDKIDVIAGRTDWTPGQATVTIDVSAADFTSTWSAQTYQADFGEPAWFGSRCAAAGDVLATPNAGPDAADLLVLQSANADARVFVIPGRPYEAGAARTLTTLDGAPSDEDAHSVRLRQEPAPATGYVAGFGTSLRGGVDLTGDGVPDVLVAHAGRGSSDQDGKAVYVFDGQAIAGAQGGDLRVDVGDNAEVGGAWPGANGSVIEADTNGQFRAVNIVGDYDGWTWNGAATPDIAISDGGYTEVQLRLNQERAAGPEVLGLYPSHEATFDNSDSDGQFSGGMWVDGGLDLDGDGWTDLLIGTANNELLIVR